MGHALRKALGVIAVSQGRGQAAGTAVLADQAGVPQLAASSFKAALDRDWDGPVAARRVGVQPPRAPPRYRAGRRTNADFHAGGSGQLSGEFVADGAASPPGDGRVCGEVCLAEDG